MTKSIRAENESDTVSQQEQFGLGIASIWVDVMRMGLLPEDEGQHDAEWWHKRQKEIHFAFRVLAGLGLADAEPLSDDKRDLQNVQELIEQEGHVIFPVLPSKKLKRLYRKASARYLRKRDEHLLRCSFGKSAP